MPLFSRNPTLFAMIATATGAAPKAVSALRRAVGCRRAVQAQERQLPSNQAPAGLEPALLRTASVQAPGPAHSPPLVMRPSGIKTLPQPPPPAHAPLLS